MPAVLVHHRVADFDTWLPIFESHASAREAAGVTKAIVWQSEADPNDVYILFKADDLSGMRAFAQSEDLKQTMLNAGVQPPVDVTFFGEGRKYEH